MNFQLSEKLKEKSFWTNFAFYAALILLIAVAYSYALFYLKAYLQNQKISEIQQKIDTWGTPEQKEQETQALTYKKKIEDFGELIENRRISLNIFEFIEKNTLPNVWFSNFSMSETNNEIRLTGEAENVSVLSRQFQILENNKDFVESINVVNSQAAASGKIRFVLSISLDPKIFAYK